MTFSTVLSSLNWDSLNNATVYIPDSLMCDGNFLICHFLSHLSKVHQKLSQNSDPDQKSFVSKTKVVFVCLSQIWNHYVLVSKKLGVNLADARQNGIVDVIDGFQILKSDSIESFSQDDGRSLLLKFHQSIIQAINAGSKQKVHLIIDDVSMLLHYGLPLTGILVMLNDIKRRIQEMNGKLVLSSHSDTFSNLVGDQNCISDQEVLHHGLQHLSSFCLWCKPLESGRTVSVDGQLFLTAGPFLEDENFQPLCLQYRLKDIGAHFFPKGFSSTVL